MFAIAFAVHLALGDDVASLKFDQTRMREHLYKCLHQKKMKKHLKCKLSAGMHLEGKLVAL